MIKPDVTVTVVGPVSTNCYTVTCPETGSTLVIDPGDEPQYIVRTLPQGSLEAILYTHGHFDHVGGAAGLKEATGAPTMLHAADLEMALSAAEVAAEWGLSSSSAPEPDRFLADGETVNIGSLEFKVIHTPGHSPGSICLFGHGYLFSGDTLFAGSIGRTDIPGSSDVQMEKSLARLTKEIPEDTVVYPGHGGSSTMASERRWNPFLR